ncbi:MAG TPA: FAD-linked oxidase C-terminal domain-containing protein [Rhodothermales bacterium]|nr:FAD-linked oxidase C-terminal domain-containing protein [Rhodothermales bacterium]
MTDAHVLDRLREIVGPERVKASAADRELYAYDGTPLLHQTPLCAVAPADAEAVGRILEAANADGFGVVPRGAGTGLSGAAVPFSPDEGDGRPCVVLLFPHWNRIEEIDEENLTAWVQPGVVTQKLHEAVEARGLFYPPDPGSQRICTLGGNVAMNSGGLRGLKYGVTGDYVMGIEGFLPTGEAFTTGGKNVKDVAGYDLKRLLVGSEGTLGVFTRLLLKLLPRPAASRTLLASYSRAVDAAATVRAIIAEKIIPATLEFVDRTTIHCVESYAHVGLPLDAESLLLMETDGHPAQVADEAEAMARIAKAHGATTVEVATSEADAERLKTARRMAFSALARLKPTTVLEDVTVPRSELPGMVEEVGRIAHRHGLLVGTFGHAGDGNLHPTILCDERDAEEMIRVHRALDDLFEAAVARGGTITGEHGVGIAKRPFFARLTSPGSLELTRRVRRAVDPNGILNPGKMLLPSVPSESLLV